MGVLPTESLGFHRIWSRLSQTKLILQVWVPVCVNHSSLCFLTPEFPSFSACVLQEELFLSISFRSRLLSIHTLTHIMITGTFCLKRKKVKVVTSLLCAANSTQYAFYQTNPSEPATSWLASHSAAGATDRVYAAPILTVPFQSIRYWTFESAILRSSLIWGFFFLLYLEFIAVQIQHRSSLHSFWVTYTVMMKDKSDGQACIMHDILIVLIWESF